MTEGPAPLEDLERLLAQARTGDRGALAQVWFMLHDELKRVARQKMRNQRPDHTLQATALVNEAFLKTFAAGQSEFRDVQHFLATAIAAMRSVLVDHARASQRLKRTAPGQRMPLHDQILSRQLDVLEILDLHQALNELGKVDPELVRLVELRFFASLSMEETARMMGKPVRTTEREWQVARRWLAAWFGQREP